jgi:hypothetical protein
MLGRLGFFRVLLSLFASPWRSWSKSLFLQMPQHELSLHVVGLDFANTDKAKSNRRFEMALCVPGERVDLVPQPKHPKDRNAVAVFTARGTQLGYLTAERAPWISRRIAAGEAYEAIFQGASPYAAVVRVRFGGGAPTLPPPSSTTPEATDFEADPEGPEWGA